MSRLTAACLLLVSIAASSGAQYGHSHVPPPKLFRLFVTPLIPPEGAERSAAFSNACFRELEKIFDTTSYLPVKVDRAEKVQDISRHMKDIIVMTDTLGRYIPGPAYDTLVVWMRYRTGLLLSRVDVVYPKGHEAKLPQLIARGVYRAVCTEFTGKLELEGGPPGMTIRFEENVTITPPRAMIFPPGDHRVVSSCPGFPERKDTITVFPGRTTKKRILLLP